MEDSALKVMRDGPVCNITGKLNLRQCKPRIRKERYISVNKRNLVTPHDIENRLRHNLRLIWITQGKNV